MATLYRQYRPAVFAEVMGQAQVTEALTAAVTQDRVTHAYLFHGPRGTGKTTTARLLAKRLNCESPKKAEPCGKCQSCQAVNEGRHVDVTEIDAASNRGIDDIRSLRERVASAPVMGKYKVYIIDEVHMLTKEAASALLKTLEEPAKHVVFILATTELHKVLPTIISRCQVYRFRRATGEEIEQRLKRLLAKEKRAAEDAVLTFIAERSDGCYRDAESLLGQLLTLQEGRLKKDALVELLGLPSQELLGDFLQGLTAGTSSPALTAVDELFASGVDPEQLLREAVRTAREQALKTADDGAKAARWAEIIRALLQAIQDLAYVPQPMIAVHLVVLTVCREKGEKKVETRASTSTNTPHPTLSPSGEKVNESPSQRKDVAPAAEGLSLKAVEKLWAKLIDAIKPDNPVASTFLRALHPTAVRESKVTVTARYPLHRTFFDNPKNKSLLDKHLSALLGQDVKATVVLDEAGSPAAPPAPAESQKNQEDKLYETVKEVFG